MTSHMTETAEE